MRICVTKKDIAKARLEVMDGNRSTCCPIAQSLKRRGYHKVLVGGEFMWPNRSKYTKFALPVRALRFIASFDFDRSVSPITFTIEKAKC